MIKINQENVEEAIRNLENYSELYKKKLSFQFFYESAASRIQYYSEVLSKDGLTRIKKSVINNFPSFFSDNKKIINLKISFHVYLLLFIDIIFLIIIVFSIFYVIKLQINLNKDYLLSLSYIQFSFMDTSIKLLNMKCLISEMTEKSIEFSFFEENLMKILRMFVNYSICFLFEYKKKLELKVLILLCLKKFKTCHKKINYFFYFGNYY